MATTPEEKWLAARSLHQQKQTHKNTTRSLELRSLWRSAFGDAALPLLAELRETYQLSPHKWFPTEKFEAYAWRVVRNAMAKTPSKKLRIAYVQRCLANLKRPKKERRA